MEENTSKGKIRNRGQVIIDCADCGQKLMVLQITKNNDDLMNESLKPVSHKVMVKCGDCKGKSYIYEIDGEFFPGAARDDIIFEPVDLEDNDVCDICFNAWVKRQQ